MDARVVATIDLERQLQEARRESGEWEWTLAAREIDWHRKLPVLGEEMGEVNKAVLNEDEMNLFEELNQVAACAVAWMESLLPQSSPERSGGGHEG